MATSIADILFGRSKRTDVSATERENARQVAEEAAARQAAKEQAEREAAKKRVEEIKFKRGGAVKKAAPARKPMAAKRPAVKAKKR